MQLVSLSRSFTGFVPSQLMPFRPLAIAALYFLAVPALAAPAVPPSLAPAQRPAVAPSPAPPVIGFPGTRPAPTAPAVRPALAVPPKKPAPAPAPAAPQPPVMFYIAHGAPDSCGRGCDRWIAVEGQINADAAVRFKTFITRHLNDRQLPIYLSSPGGNLEQGLFIGNMLREMSAVARVGRTIVNDCGFEAQGSEVCLKLKRSGRELAANLSTRAAQCNSACPYLMLGAAKREVAPDAILGVHSPKVVLRYSGNGQLTSEMVTAAAQRAVQRGDRMLSDYVVRMGIEGGLLDVARRIRFEDMHVLTRDEIFRFGIDRREFVETPWAYENLGRPLIRKSAIARTGDGKSWRALQWRLFCLNPEQFQLEYHRQTVAVSATVLPVISISSGAAKPLTFAFPPVKLTGSEAWQLRLSRSSALAMAALPELDLTETANALDGRRSSHAEKLSGEGLAQSLDSLVAVCPAAKPQTAPQQSGLQNVL
jgi:hypothetical protein